MMIRVENSQQFLIEDSTFSDVNVEYLYLTQSTTNIVDSTFTSDRISDKRAFTADLSTITLTDSTFEGFKKTDDNGGAILSQSTITTINNCTFKHNQASEGAGIYLDCQEKAS